MWIKLNGHLKNLSVCEIGEKLVVEKLTPSLINSKLLEMGIYVGKPISILFKAPFGDPIAVQIGDYVLSMRKSEAETILVKAALNEN